MRLSPTTSYYIRNLFRHCSNEATDISASRSTSPTDALSNLDEVLQSLYLSETEISTVIQRLESLVYLHRSLHSQTLLYADYTDELAKVEQQIYRLLGCQRVEA